MLKSWYVGSVYILMANPHNEERAREIIKAEYPNVIMSHSILRRSIEFDRFSSAAIAAYVQA